MNFPLSNRVLKGASSPYQVFPTVVHLQQLHNNRCSEAFLRSHADKAIHACPLKSVSLRSIQAIVTDVSSTNDVDPIFYLTLTYMYH